MEELYPYFLMLLGFTVLGLLAEVGRASIWLGVGWLIFRKYLPKRKR